MFDITRERRKTRTQPGWHPVIILALPDLLISKKATPGGIRKLILENAPHAELLRIVNYGSKALSTVIALPIVPAK